MRELVPTLLGELQIALGRQEPLHEGEGRREEHRAVLPHQLMAERGRQMRGVRCTRRARLHFVGAMVPGCVASLLSRG